jgi:uncharacterized protein (UPF0548 family)
MFSIRQPTDAAIRAHLARHAEAPFTYGFVGATRDEPQPVRGFHLDRNRVRLGQGRETYERARQAIRRWQMFPESMARLCWRDEAPREGLTVGVLYRIWVAPLWVLFPARVVYTVDETSGPPLSAVERFGFAYGTVADHPERGEERFQVEWHEATGEVFYDLVAISQPAHWLAWWGFPYTRFEQARFRRLSGEVMAAGV